MPRTSTRPLAGWGNVPLQTCDVFRPEKQREVEALVAQLGSEALPHAISRGLGRSYGDASLNDGSGVILNTRLDRMLEFDARTGVLHAEAGTTLADILELFVPRGWFLPVTPGTKFVTLGGALAADVHGKNHHKDGSLAPFVDDLHLLTANGEILHCSPTENADVFWATIGGMGLTGIILSARLRLQPVKSGYIEVRYDKAKNLDDALERFSGDDDKYQYSVAWIDCLASGSSLGRSVLMRGNHALPEQLSATQRTRPLAVSPPRKKTVPFDFPSFVLNSWTVRAFNAAFYAKHSDGVKIEPYDTFFYPLDAINHWNRMYGRRGFVQYQVAFPPSTSREGLIEVLQRFVKSQRASFLAVLKTFGPSSDGLLSFPFPGHTLALDLPYTGDDLVTLLREMDQIVLRHDGRVYPAKDAWVERETFAQMYPRLDEFREIKRRLDPGDVFQSSLARRVGIVEAS